MPDVTGSVRYSLEELGIGAQVRVVSDRQTYDLRSEGFDGDDSMIATIKPGADPKQQADKRVPIDPDGQQAVLRGTINPDSGKYVLAVWQGCRLHFVLPTSVTGATEWSIGPVRELWIGGEKIF